MQHTSMQFHKSNQSAPGAYNKKVINGKMVWL